MTHTDLKEAAMKAEEVVNHYFQKKGWYISDDFNNDGHFDEISNYLALANPSRIASLIEENERLREALTPFAKFNAKIDAHPDASRTPDDYCIHDGLMVGDFRRARAALKNTP